MTVPQNEKPAGPNPDDIEILHVLGALKRNALRLLAASAIVGALTYTVLSMVAPRYEAEAELAVMARDTGNPFKDPQAGANSSGAIASRMDKEAINTHVRSLRSPDLVTEIINDLDLNRVREFNAALGPVDQLDATLRSMGVGGPRAGENEADRVLNAVYDRLAVFSPPDSRIITIRFTATDPQVAADAANALADAYRERLAKATLVETDAVQDALAPKIAKLAEEVVEADSAVSRFRSETGLLRGGSQKTPLSDQQLGDLTAELTRVRAARSAAEARASSARRLLKNGTPEVIPEVQRSALIQNLIQQKVQVERDLLKASATMKSAHPVIRQLRADLNAAQRQVASEVANLVASLDKEAFIAAEQEAAIVAGLDKVKASVADNSGDEVKLRQLEATAKSKRAELERLQSQFEANRARAESGAVPVEAQIVTRARPSSVPVSPRKSAFTLLAAVGTLLFGMAGVIIAALSAGARPGAAQQAGPTPVATSAPVLSDDVTTWPVPAAVRAPQANTDSLASAAKAARRAQEITPVSTTPKPPMSEPATDAILQLQDIPNLTEALAGWANATSSGFRTLIADTGDGRALAHHAANLAAALTAQGGQSLLIDWAPDGKGIAAELSAMRSPGFSELLDGASAFADVVRRVPGSRTHMIASGSALAAGVDGLDADQLNLVLDALDEAYDHIIVVSRYDAARLLFETVQGRFDAGITLFSEGMAPGDDELRPGRFLGYDVTDIELVGFTPGSAGLTGQAGRAA